MLKDYTYYNNNGKNGRVVVIVIVCEGELRRNIIFMWLVVDYLSTPFLCYMFFMISMFALGTGMALHKTEKSIILFRSNLLFFTLTESPI